MILFARFAFFTLVRDAVVVAMVAILLMLAFSFEPLVAIDVGGTVALIFALGLLARVFLLTEARFTRSEAWSALQDNERPVGNDGLLWARAEWERMVLRFAKASAGISGILFGSSLVVSVA